jgi:hypothetical protein
MLARSLLPCLAGTLLALATGPASAGDPPGRREFLLRYRQSVMINEEVGYGGQHLQPSSRKPQRITQEPKYHSREPLYATVRIGVSRDPITLVLDNSSGEGLGYDILYVDADGDGRITAAEQVPGLPLQDGQTFGPLRLMIDCGGERCPQWFLVQLAEYPQENGQVYRNLQFTNAGYYQGIVTFGEQKRLFAVVDANGNGLYNDYHRDADAIGDRLLVDANGDGKLDPAYNGDEAQPLGRYLEVGGRYWKLDVAADGSSVTVEPLDRPLGTLRADVADFTLLLTGEHGILRARGRDGTVIVPAGTYRLAQCDYKLTEPGGKPWTLSARGTDRSPAVPVPADGEAHFPFGPPFLPRVLTNASAFGPLSLNLELSGAGGEVYTNIQVSSMGRPPVPKVRLLDAADRELALLDFHYG